MKTIFAHWKKDLLSSRGLLIAWALCIGLIAVLCLARVVFPQALESFVKPQGEGFPVGLAMLFAAMTGLVGVVIVQFLLGSLLLIQVVHLDPLTNPDAFWRTRPISTTSLLAAKSLYVLLLLLGGAVSYAFLFFNANSWGSALVSAVTTLLGVFAFAAITSNLLHVILNWLAITILAGIASQIVLGLWHQAAGFLQGPALTLASTGGPAWLPLIYLVGFGGAVACQYLTLRTNTSRGILFATYLLGSLAQGRG